MIHSLPGTAPKVGRSGKSGVEQVKQALIAGARTIVLSACGLPAGRVVRAYDACIARHPQGTAICEGPRQAYEVDTLILQARTLAISPVTVGSYVQACAA